MMISIVIPNYNHAQFLRERIDSVLKQSYTDIEIIILDDFSSDASGAIIEEFKGQNKIVHIEFNSINSGSPFKQWERGLKLAKGDFIWIAESDDVADSQFLEKAIPNFIDPEVVLVFTDCKIINEESEILHINNPWIHDSSLDIGHIDRTWYGQDFLNQYQRYRNFVSNASSAVFRKNVVSSDIIEQIINYRYSGDWLFWNNLALKGKVTYIPEPLCSWRSHDASTRSIADLQKDFSRLKEASSVISGTNQLLKKKAVSSNYDWILNWWLSRYSYSNLWKSYYIFPSLPFKRLYPVLYWKLFSRTFKEIFFSVKRKLS